MERYSLIHDKFPREFVLLQGTGCRWKKCAYCDYFHDVSENPYELNSKELEKVTGHYGVLDVINSGSAMELDRDTISLIKHIVAEKKIHTIWFESHYMYRTHLEKFARQFAPAKVKFRCGIETFDASLRNKWTKGIPSEVTARDVAKYFDGICLLCGTKGESKERIISDIDTALKYFEYISVNLFNKNTTSIEVDEDLQRWFVTEVYPHIKDNPAIEVLLQNTDLGVG
ncbi:MAG: hypothetical protein IJ352_02800 [Muribaculaceae bacterium]|nr:hypothetical protein [Muribaculaceae bacterium]MBQ7853940.1 hypothetical protein [Muribaculaceae bacterium]